MLPLLLILALADTPAAAPPADLTAPPADAQRSENRLVTKRLAEGTGTAKPDADDLVKVRYTVWKADGSLVQHVPSPRWAIIAVRKMVPGWGLAVQQMVVGERQRSWVPPGLNGGKLDLGLVFDTELIEIIDYPHAPPDVAAPPADATVTPSGLAFKILQPGTGTEHPKARSTVRVHYSGWTTDGQLFDSSTLRGVPAEFSLGGVIKGWTEGLQLMVAGEKRRFWIPAKLAYGSDKSKPQGPLVFDIELLDVE
jgi:FKBP-type peptidyl-prolyl cis-trans isomerase